MTPRILLVDDDEAFVAVLTDALSEREYEVSAVGTGNAALHAIPEQQPDLILLDLGLPDDDGLVLLPSLRKLTQAPIIVLSARDAQSDRVVSLKLGADDFIRKPFDLLDLEARIDAKLRIWFRAQVQASPSPDLRAGDIEIMIARGRVNVADRPMHATRLELQVLTMLVRRVGETVSRTELYEKIWGWEQTDTRGALEASIWRLRNKLRDAGSNTELKAVHKQGYTLRT